MKLLEEKENVPLFISREQKRGRCTGGFKDTIAGTGMEFVDAYSANGSIETACQIAEDLMTSTPDIAAISCFDGSTPRTWNGH